MLQGAEVASISAPAASNPRAILVYLLMKPSDSLLLPAEVAVSLVGLIAVALGVAIVSERLRMAWERAVAAEKTKDLLLRELGHRTQNNLALVASVLSLQARTKDNPETRSALEKAVARVQAIASAHEHFQPYSHDGRVEMRPYDDAARSLCRPGQRRAGQRCAQHGQRHRQRAAPWYGQPPALVREGDRRLPGRG